MIASVTAYWPIFEPFLLPLAVLMLKTIIQRKICDRQNDDGNEVPSTEVISEQNRMKSYYKSVFTSLESQRQQARNSNFLEIGYHDQDTDGDIESKGSLEEPEKAASKSKRLTKDRTTCLIDMGVDFITQPRSVSFDNAIFAC
jgi:hypothetical protein